MNVSGRRALYTLAIAIFALAAPLILFFSRGYRFDFRQFRIVGTGGVLIDSIPRGAQPTLDSQSLRHVTPTLLTLLPGSYNLTLVKEGYRTWKTTVEIRPSQTERLAATLLPESPRTVLLPLPGVRLLEPEVQTGNIALLSSQEGKMTIGIASPQRITYRSLVTFDGEATPNAILRWSANGRNLALLSPDQSVFIVRVSDGSTLPLPWPELTAARHVVWDRSNDNIFYALRESSLWKVDLFTQTAQVIASPGVVDAFTGDGGLWILRNMGQTSEAQRLDPFGVNRILERRALSQRMLKIIGLEANRFILSDGHRVMVVDRNGAILQSLPTEGVIEAQRDRASQVILIRAGEELWTLNLETLETSLVVRTIDLQGAAWHPKRPVVFTLIRGVLKAFEDASGHLVTTELNAYHDPIGLSRVDATTIAVITRNDVSFLEVAP